MIAAVFLAAALNAAAAIAPQSGSYWMKTYSLAPYREIWSGDLSVKKVDAALPKIVAVVEKSGEIGRASCRERVCLAV